MKTFPTPITIVDYDLRDLQIPEQLCEVIPKHQDMFKSGEFTIGQIKLYDGTYNIIGMNNDDENQSYLCFSHQGDAYLICCEDGGFSSWEFTTS